jgi:nucleotide-binding universal stress UspA family protein
MGYKAIVVHVDQSRHALQRIRIAAGIALRDNARLIGVAMAGISRCLPEGDAIDRHGPVLATHPGHLRKQAAQDEQALALCEATVRRMGVLAREKRLVGDAPAGGFILEARYADLAPVPR